MQPNTNLIAYIISPVSDNLNKELESFRYHNIEEESELITNNNGIDIIAYQLELKFKGQDPIYVSWGTIDGWEQYSLCVSRISFANALTSYVILSKNWQRIIGKKLKSFAVYGCDQHEPHLLTLSFSDDNILGVANFYFQEDFIPNLTIGDDIWIIFNQSSLESFITTLSLEKLYSSEPSV